MHVKISGPAVKEMERAVKTFLVPPGKKIDLRKDYNPSFRLHTLSKKESKQILEDGIKNLAEEQDKLYAQNTYAILIILQAMDAAGKDGTIKHVMSGVNPQGCRVVSFKAPSAEELDHDYLWRCCRALPPRGDIGIFNRSYYEEVLITRVHPEILNRQQLPPEARGEDIWKRRFEEINNFEKYLANNGILPMKFFLNVSKKEQKRRFLDRIERKDKNWKLSVSDAKERGYWNDYMNAYEDCFNHTSTKWAPWYVIPADFKPFTRLAVGYIVYQKLASLNLAYPTLEKDQRKLLGEARNILMSEKE
jgi:PPK2 family polyphosphate:nucleotide phosphotransferase